MSKTWPTRLARWGCGALQALAVGLAGTGAAHAQSSPLEFAVKAAYLHKLAAFVQWPSSAFGSPVSPIEFCVAGASPFGVLLRQAVADQRIGSHPILLREIDRSDRAAGCHVLYLAGPNAAAVAQGLRKVRGTPVLTVTDSAFQDGATGIVHFVVRDKRVRFEIDDDAAVQNGITLSSKLLSLAVSPGPRS